MATRTLYFDGQIASAPASMTITAGGTQIFSGTVGAGLELDTDGILASANITTADDMQVDSLAISIAVTSGIVRIGAILADATVTGLDEFFSGATDEQKQDIYSLLSDDNTRWAPGREHRTNILIDSVAPAFPGTVSWNGSDFTPGTSENPDYTGWRFEVSAGETFTCNLLVPSQKPWLVPEA